MQNHDLGITADRRKLAEPADRVERVPAQELERLIDRTAEPAVLVTPVRLELWLAREVEVEVRRLTRRTSRATEDHLGHAGNRRLELRERRPVREKLTERPLRVPRP